LKLIAAKQTRNESDESSQLEVLDSGNERKQKEKIKLKPDFETKTNNKWKEQFDLQIEATHSMLSYSNLPELSASTLHLKALKPSHLLPFDSSFFSQIDPLECFPLMMSLSGSG